MNKCLAVWGLLLFIGFIFTHYLVFSADPSLAAPLWVVLVVIGAAYCRCACGCKPAKGKKNTCGCGCCCSDLWAVAVVEGLILTVAIAIGLLPISMFYILSVWLLVIGSAMVAESLRDKKALKMQLGLFWLFCAVFFPFVSNYQPATFILGALVFGVTAMLAGIVGKD
jgi:hypothetical protein